LKEKKMERTVEKVKFIPQFRIEGDELIEDHVVMWNVKKQPENRHVHETMSDFVHRLEKNNGDSNVFAQIRDEYDAWLIDNSTFVGNLPLNKWEAILPEIGIALKQAGVTHVKQLAELTEKDLGKLAIENLKAIHLGAKRYMERAALGEAEQSKTAIEASEERALLDLEREEFERQKAEFLAAQEKQAKK
jgi:hypothetical protein